MPTISNASPESPVIISGIQKQLSSSSKAFREVWSRTSSGHPFQTLTKPPKRKQFKALSRVKWSKTSSALDAHSHEETNATINEGGSKIRRINKIVATAGTKTQTGDRTQNHLNTTPPRPHRLTRMFQFLWTSTALEPLREEDAQ